MASSGHLDYTDVAPDPDTPDPDLVLNWVRRTDGQYVARSRHGELLRISAEGDLHDAMGVLFLESPRGEKPSEILGQGTAEDLRMMADRFEASPALFRFVRDVNHIVPSRTA